MDTLVSETARVSATYYNIGLSKAKVRDLSGAVQNLKLSIILNKNNIDSRNLLGLIYCEMGDVVEALSQWVISKNIKSENNIAESYIKKIQSDQNKFEAVTNAIKKYNLSLKYAQEKNIDMAVIQLKKITAQNSGFVKAQLLLALLYIENTEYSRARKCLNAVLKVDHNNLKAQTYLKEIDEQLKPQKDTSIRFVSKKTRNEYQSRPLSGNDVIVPGSSYKEPSNGAVTVVTVLIGIAIGAALIWFLIIPARYQGITAEYNKSLQQYSEQLSSGNVELNSMESELKDVKQQKEALETKLEQISGEGGSNKYLTDVIKSANLYLQSKNTEAAEAIAGIDVSELPSDDAKALFNTISGATMTNAANELYNKGKQYYYSSDYKNATDYLQRAYKCDKTKEDAVYLTAKSYVALNDSENAKKYYKIIVDDFKTSTHLKEAQDYVDSH